MSNFYCDKCGCPILEDEHGDYVTGCPHYPLESLLRYNKKTKYTDITQFKFPPIQVEMELGFCESCFQMTNHDKNGKCLKCKK